MLRTVKDALEKKKVLFFSVVALGIVAFLLYPVIANFLSPIRIISSSVEPYKIKVGEVQTTTVSIESVHNIEKVLIQVPFEGGYDEVFLSLVQGDEKKGVWEGKWTAHNTLVKEYRTKIIALDIYGNKAQDENFWWDDTETFWLEGWGGRERVVVTETSGSTLTNHKTEITIPYRNEMQPDFDDIRFTSADGITLLGYYLAEKTDSVTSTFWVTIPSLYASADTSIYYYFGNPEAMSVSDSSYAPGGGSGFSSWTETSTEDFADGTMIGTRLFGSGTAGGVELQLGANDYRYLREIAITNNIAQDLVGYQVSTTLDTQSLISAGKMQSDCDDIRLFESDGTTSIPYWIESGCNTNSTIIWMKTSLSSSASKYVYMFYGNGDSSSASDGKSVFDFFDNFDTADTSMWTFPQNYYDITNGVLHVFSNNNGDQSAMTVNQFGNNVTVRSSIKSAHSGVFANYYERPVGFGSSTGEVFFGAVDGSFPSPRLHNYASPSGTFISVTGWSAGTWYTTELKRASNRSIFSFSGGTFTNSSNYPIDNEYLLVRAISSTSVKAEVWMDWVAVRNYISTEPTVVSGNELSAFSGTYISSTFDAGSPVKLNSFSFSAVTPFQTSVKFQLAANNDNSTWNFTGPDGTASTYYTTSGSSLHYSLSGKRYIKYKAYLESSDLSATLVLESVTIEYAGYYDSWTETTTADFLNGSLSDAVAEDDSIRLATGVGIVWQGSVGWDVTPPLSGDIYNSLSSGDLDGDGDLDLMVGTNDGITYGYRNTGTDSSPVWTLEPSWNAPDIGYVSIPALADLNNDGLLDLMIGSLLGVCHAYRNTGTTSAPVWTAQESWNTVDVGNDSAPAFVDLDGDGDYDLMIGEGGGVVKAYKNTGTTSSPVWTAESSWDSPDVGGFSMPTFADLDGDGDYDMLIGEETGPIYAYKNIGTASAPVWFASGLWDAPQAVTFPAPHLADLDGDGDYDLLVGKENSIPVYRNDAIVAYESPGIFTSSVLDIGTSSRIYSLFSTTSVPTDTSVKFQLAVNNDNSTWNYVGPDGTSSSYFTSNSDSISSSSFVGNRYVRYKAYLETSNAAVTPVVYDVSINYAKIWLQTTTGDFSGGTMSDVVSSNGSLMLHGTMSTDPNWIAQSSWNTDDLGDLTTPSLADLDGDGDLDFMSGLTGGTCVGYRNTGSVIAPAWTAVAGWGVSKIGGNKNFAPALGNLGGDTDIDLMIGTSGGIVYGYENTGTASAPAWTARSGWNTPNVGTNSNPALGNLDGAGGLDLMIGLSTGNVVGYRNTGTSSAPAWTAEPNWNVAIGGTDAAPTLADLDGDGLLDLLVGAADGITYAFKNTGSASAPTWTAQASWNVADIGDNAAPTLGDLDGDGYLDLLIGSSLGFNYAYRNAVAPVYSSSGNLISSVFDANGSINLGFLHFTAATPSGTLVKFQLSTNDDNSTWDFTGPDGTASTYYTLDGDPISLSLAGNRYVRYKAYLETSNTALTPALNEVYATYIAAASGGVEAGPVPSISFTGQIESRPRPPGASGVSGGGFMGF